MGIFFGKKKAGDGGDAWMQRFSDGLRKAGITTYNEVLGPIVNTFDGCQNDLSDALSFACQTPRLYGLSGPKGDDARAMGKSFIALVKFYCWLNTPNGQKPDFKSGLKDPDITQYGVSYPKKYKKVPVGGAGSDTAVFLNWVKDNENTLAAGNQQLFKAISAGIASNSFQRKGGVSWAALGELEKRLENLEQAVTKLAGDLQKTTRETQAWADEFAGRMKDVEAHNNRTGTALATIRLQSALRTKQFSQLKNKIRDSEAEFKNQIRLLQSTQDDHKLAQETLEKSFAVSTQNMSADQKRKYASVERAFIQIAMCRAHGLIVEASLVLQHQLINKLDSSAVLARKLITAVGLAYERYSDCVSQANATQQHISDGINFALKRVGGKFGFPFGIICKVAAIGQDYIIKINDTTEVPDEENFEFSELRVEADDNVAAAAAMFTAAEEELNQSAITKVIKRFKEEATACQERGALFATGYESIGKSEVAVLEEYNYRIEAFNNSLKAQCYGAMKGALNEKRIANTILRFCKTGESGVELGTQVADQIVKCMERELGKEILQGQVQNQEPNIDCLAKTIELSLYGQFIQKNDITSGNWTGYMERMERLGVCQMTTDENSAHVWAQGKVPYYGYNFGAITKDNKNRFICTHLAVSWFSHNVKMQQTGLVGNYVAYADNLKNAVAQTKQFYDLQPNKTFAGFKISGKKFDKKKVAAEFKRIGDIAAGNLDAEEAGAF